MAVDVTVEHHIPDDEHRDLENRVAKYLVGHEGWKLVSTLPT